MSRNSAVVHSRSNQVFSPEQDATLQRKIGEALIDQMLHEGQGESETLVLYHALKISFVTFLSSPIFLVISFTYRWLTLASSRWQTCSQAFRRTM